MYHNIYVSICFSITAHTHASDAYFILCFRAAAVINQTVPAAQRPQAGEGQREGVGHLVSRTVVSAQTPRSFMAPSQVMEDTLKQLSKEIITPKFAAIKHSCSTALSECSILISTQRVISFLVTGSSGDIYAGCLGCRVTLYVLVVV